VEDERGLLPEVRLRRPPALIVVAANTALSELIEQSLKRGDIIRELAGDYAFRIDSKALAEAGGRRRGHQGRGGRAPPVDDEHGRQIEVAWRQATGGLRGPGPAGKNIRALVSVGMLTEGWDAANVTQILGLRAFTSSYCANRCRPGTAADELRRRPRHRLLSPEYADIFGVPFEVIPVKGVAPGDVKPLPPSTLVQALESRKDLAIEFRASRAMWSTCGRASAAMSTRCPLGHRAAGAADAGGDAHADGWTPAGGRPATAGAAETLTREQFYAEHRLQRTTFEIARDITEVLAGGRVAMGTAPPPKKLQDGARLLFPQVLAVVEEYLAGRVDVAPEARIEEVALAIYRDVVVSRLLDSIEPDAAAGETPLLPASSGSGRQGALLTCCSGPPGPARRPPRATSPT